MEFVVSSAIAVMMAAGVYLVLRARTFPVVLGLSLMTYAVNVFLFATGRLAVNLPPVISAEATAYTDPLPQALVLTAIVISFGMTAVIVVMALRSYLESGTDHVDLGHATHAGDVASSDNPARATDTDRERATGGGERS